MVVQACGLDWINEQRNVYYWLLTHHSSHFNKRSRAQNISRIFGITSSTEIECRWAQTQDSSMAHLVRECCALYFKPTFQSEYWVEHKAMPRVKAPMMTTRAIIFHTHCLNEWISVGGGREKERYRVRGKGGLRWVSSMKSVDFCGDSRQAKNRI